METTVAPKAVETIICTNPKFMLAHMLTYLICKIKFGKILQTSNLNYNYCTLSC